MKKIYSKPSLRTELFAVENIMTEVDTDKDLLSVSLTGLMLGETSLEAITLSDNQRLESINYADFQ